MQREVLQAFVIKNTPVAYFSKCEKLAVNNKNSRILIEYTNNEFQVSKAQKNLVYFGDQELFRLFYQGYQAE